MPLLNHSFSCAFSELKMQNNVIKFMGNYTFYKNMGQSWENALREIFSETRITDIGRISDIIIWLNKKTLVNIECKLTNIPEVIHQAKSHLQWADYSYVCMPYIIYIAPHHIARMIEFDLGLLLYDDKNKNVYEVVYAPFNRKKSKDLRGKVTEKLQSILNKKEEGMQLQCIKTS